MQHSNPKPKPEFLYHGSPNKDLDVLKPMNLTVRDPKEGEVIFATKDKMYASVFIVPSDDSWSHICAFSSGTEGPEGKLERKQYAVFADKERFEKSDKGGAIYKVPAGSFNLDNKYGSTEWTSREPVKPVSKEEFASGMEAMKKYGVVVLFVDMEMLMKLKRADDHGLSLLSELEAVK